MVRKTFLTVIFLIFIIIGWFYYYCFGSPSLFLDGLQWALTPRHEAIVDISSISWVKLNNASTIKNVFLDFGEVPNKEGFLYVLHHTSYVTGGYGTNKPEPPTKFEGVTYTLRFKKEGVMQWGFRTTPNKLSSLGKFHSLNAPISNMIFKPFLQPVDKASQ